MKRIPLKIKQDIGEMKFKAKNIHMTALRENLMCLQHCHVDAQGPQVWDALVAQCLSTSDQRGPLSLKHS